MKGVLNEMQNVSEVIISYDISLGDIINAIMLLFTLMGLIFTIIKLRQNKIINRASFIKELYFQFYNDKEIMDAFYHIEYDENPDDGKYDSQLHNSEFGRKFDKLLSFFEIVCDMYYRNIITKKRFGNFFI